MSYSVKVKLLTDINLFDIQTRVEEVHTIRDWVMELVGYDETLFDMKYMSDGEYLNIWFDDEKHAMVCQLRWG